MREDLLAIVLSLLLVIVLVVFFIAIAAFLGEISNVEGQDSRPTIPPPVTLVPEVWLPQIYGGISND